MLMSYRKEVKIVFLVAPGCFSFPVLATSISSAGAKFQSIHLANCKRGERGGSINPKSYLPGINIF